MKRNPSIFLGKVAIFLSLTGVLYIALICLWGEMTPDFLHKNLNYRIGSNGHMFSRIQQVKKTKNVDILFLGSSHSYRGLDPRIFKKYGFYSFNLGSSAQTPLQTEYLIKKYLAPLNPKLVIFEVNPGSFSNDGVESQLDLIANDKNDWNSVKLALQINHIKVYNTLIYGFYKDIFHANKNFVEKTEIKGDKYICGGFVERKMAFFKNKRQFKMEDLVIDDNQLKAFKNIIAVLKARKINYILVQAPITKAKYKSYKNMGAFNMLMKRYGAYYDFNENSTLDDHLHFYDFHHLNQDGVRIFDKNLISLLLQEHPDVNKQPR